jgi:hypothetical protein
MEHLKIKTSAKEVKFPKMKVLDFTTMSQYWAGGCAIMPEALKNMEFTNYENNKCLTWYERQKEHHDQIMEEFKNIFKWRKK